MVDVWAVGCILYTLLGGYQPFYSKFVSDLVELIKRGKYDFNSEIWNQTSDVAKDLIKQLLQTDPGKRVTVVNALKHKWFAIPDLAEMDKRFSDQDFRNNLIRNQRRLTRHLNSDEVESKTRTEFSSFNKICRNSVFLKEAQINPFRE